MIQVCMVFIYVIVSGLIIPLGKLLIILFRGDTLWYKWKKRYLIPIYFMGNEAVGFCLTVPKQTATAAIYVEDIKNIAENAKNSYKYLYKML